MIKCLIGFFTAAAVSLTTQSFAAIPGYNRPPGEVRVFMNSKEVKLNLPILYSEGRYLYPFRELLEHVDAVVVWNSEKKQAEAIYNGTTIAFPQGKKTYTVNGEEKTMDVKTMADPASGRTYVPIRFAFEALGFDVDWIQCEKHNEIRISNLGPYKIMSDEEFLKKYFNSDHTSNNYYDPDTVNKRMIFKDEYGLYSFTDYRLNEKNNPDINRQVYDLTKTLCDAGRYVYLYYRNFKDFEILQVKYGVDYAKVINGVTFFDFYFLDNKPYNIKKDWQYDKFSENSVVVLDLSALWWDFYSEHWSTPFYEKKLRDSLIALFGDKNGKDIYKFVFEEYIKYRTIDEKIWNYYWTKKVKRFDNIQVDLGIDNSAILHFFFSFNKNKNVFSLYDP